MKLTYRNNWEADEYFVDGNPIMSLQKVRIDGVDYNVTAKEVRKTYSDYGHTYEAVSTHYFVKTKIFGKVTEVDLNTVVGKVQVSALTYSAAKNK